MKAPGRSSDSRITRPLRPSRRLKASVDFERPERLIWPAFVSFLGDRPRLQRRDRPGFSPGSLFKPETGYLERGHCRGKEKGLSSLIYKTVLLRQTCTGFPRGRGVKHSVCTA